MKKAYTNIFIGAVRFSVATLLFAAISVLANRTSYFIAEDMTADVSEDAIRFIHIAIAVLAYYSLFKAFIITDNKSKEFKIRSFVISIAVTAVFFVLFPTAFAVESLYGWSEINRIYVYLILIAAFALTNILAWISADKALKNKSNAYGIGYLIKHIIISFLIYPLMAYMLPIFVPTLRTLPKTLFLIAAIVVPILLAIIAAFAVFDYIRAFFVRRKFLKKLKKAAKKNGYKLSKIVHPYLSLFVDYNDKSFSIEANGKKYDCKFLAGISYGDPMHFEDDGKGRIIRHITLRYRTLRAAPFAKSGMMWQKLPDNLAEFETHFTYNFESDNKKVLIICPTPHSVFATGQGQNRLLDVNDVIYGYTIMTGTAFINALERDAVK